MVRNILNVQGGKMSYYFSKILNVSFDKAIEKATEELQKEGFGILTEIDVKATMKKKLDVDYPNYKILGSCNPPFAHKALQAEPLIGTMLPCNVIVRETKDGQVEVAAVDPIASMQSIQNPSLGEIAQEVQVKLKKVVESI
jgi:uncharacterized protein (DUF302 family)